MRDFRAAKAVFAAASSRSILDIDFKLIKNTFMENYKRAI